MLTCAQATSKEQSIRIASSGGLSEDQIQNMVREAEANAEKDKAVRQLLCFVPTQQHFCTRTACTLPGLRVVHSLWFPS